MRLIPLDTRKSGNDKGSFDGPNAINKISNIYTRTLREQ